MNKGSDDYNMTLAYAQRNVAEKDVKISPHKILMSPNERAAYDESLVYAQKNVAEKDVEISPQRYCAPPTSEHEY